MARLPNVSGWVEGVAAVVLADLLMVGFVGWVCGWWG